MSTSYNAFSNSLATDITNGIMCDHSLIKVTNGKLQFKDKSNNWIDGKMELQSSNDDLPELMICNFANMDDKEEGGGGWWGKVANVQELNNIVNKTNLFCYYFLLKLKNELDNAKDELNNPKYSHPYFATVKTNLNKLLADEAMNSRDETVTLQNLENLEQNYNTCYKSISSILTSSPSQTQESEESGSSTQNGGEEFPLDLLKPFEKKPDETDAKNLNTLADLLVGALNNSMPHDKNGFFSNVKFDLTTWNKKKEKNNSDGRNEFKYLFQFGEKFKLQTPGGFIINKSEWFNKDRAELFQDNMDEIFTQNDDCKIAIICEAPKENTLKGKEINCVDLTQHDQIELTPNGKTYYYYPSKKTIGIYVNNSTNIRIKYEKNSTNYIKYFLKTYDMAATEFLIVSINGTKIAIWHGNSSGDISIKNWQKFLFELNNKKVIYLCGDSNMTKDKQKNAPNIAMEKFIYNSDSLPKSIKKTRYPCNFILNNQFYKGGGKSEIDGMCWLSVSNALSPEMKALQAKIENLPPERKAPLTPGSTEMKALKAKIESALTLGSIDNFNNKGGKKSRKKRRKKTRKKKKQTKKRNTKRYKKPTRRRK